MTALRTTLPQGTAPWAEIVPDAPYPMTVEDMYNWPEDGYRYEVVEGVLVRMPGTHPAAGRVTRRLQLPLATYVQTHDLGTVTLPDEIYDLERTGQGDTGLVPDLGFYPHESDALIGPRGAIPFAPALAIEVARQSQRQNAKACRFLAAGTALVWVLWPSLKRIDVWRRDGNGHAPTPPWCPVTASAAWMWCPASPTPSLTSSPEHGLALFARPYRPKDGATICLWQHTGNMSCAETDGGAEMAEARGDDFHRNKSFSEGDAPKPATGQGSDSDSLGGMMGSAPMRRVPTPQDRPYGTARVP